VRAPPRAPLDLRLPGWTRAWPVALPLVQQGPGFPADLGPESPVLAPACCRDVALRLYLGALFRCLAWPGPWSRSLAVFFGDADCLVLQSWLGQLARSPLGGWSEGAQARALSGPLGRLAPKVRDRAGLLAGESLLAVPTSSKRCWPFGLGRKCCVAVRERPPLAAWGPWPGGMMGPPQSPWPGPGGDRGRDGIRMGRPSA